jgi:type II secretion system protein G
MKSRSGFTIVELLIVIVVIAILATITIIAFNGAQARARDARRDSSLATIKRALEMYKLDNGQYPYACSNDPNLDCTMPSLASYLQPTYINSFPLLENKTGVPAMYYAQASRYTIVVPYETKDPCKTGVNPRTDYKTEYALCS